MDPARGGRRLAPAGVALILAVILFAPATLGGKVLSASDIPLFSSPYPPQPPGAQPQNPLQFDAANVFEPDGLAVRDALRGWRLPVWTSRQEAGEPLLAAQQSAPLYPLTWVDVVFPYWRSLAWVAVLKLVLAFVGTFLLARALRLGLAAGLIAGLAFGFGSYLVDWLSHPHADAYVLLPWAFLAAERLIERRRVRDAGLLGLALGIAYLGGQPESSMLVTLAVAGWVVYRLVAAGPRTVSVNVVALAAGALLLAVGLAAVMLIPFGEALRQSYDTSRAQPPLPLRSLLSAVFPEFWGRPDRAGLSVGPANFTERTLYVGALPLLLAVAGLLPRGRRGPQLFFAGLAVVSLLVALDTGPITKAVRHIPLLHVADMNRALVLASFALAMLAGFGCERLLNASAGERRRMLIAAGVLAGLPVAITILAHPSWLGDLPEAVRRLFGGGASASLAAIGLASVIRWLLFALVAISLVAVPALWRRRGPPLAAAALALVALDLIAMGWGYNPAIPESQADPARPPAIAAAQLLTGAGGGRVMGIGALEPNTASRWGLRDASGHEDPVVERPQKLLLELSGGINTALFGGTPSAATSARPLDIFGVDALVLGPPGSGLERRIAAALPGSRVAYSGPGAVVLSNPGALPPAFVAYRWRPSSGLDDSLRMMAASTPAQARDDPVIETADRPPAGAARPATPARVLSRSDTHVTLAVQAAAPGRLTLLDTYYPGWKASVDGRSVHIDASDAAFRSVSVAAGRHTVSFSYEPGSVLWGGIASLVALAAIVLCIALGGGGRRRGGRSEVEEPAHAAD